MENQEFIEKYNDWNIKKQNIHFLNNEEFYFKEGDIWWCSIGLNIGSESYGKGKDFRRPILIVKKLSEDLCVVLPLTSKKKMGSWFVNIKLDGIHQCIMLYQIRTLNRKRFQRKIGELSYDTFIDIKEKLKILLELSENNHPTEVEIERVDGISTPKDDSIITKE